MRSIQSSAKTMEEAVTQGLEKLGVSLGDVTIDILDEGSKGFLGLMGGKPVKVKLTVRDGVDDSDILSAFSLSDAVRPEGRLGGQSRSSKAEKARSKAKADDAKPGKGKPDHEKAVKSAGASVDSSDTDDKPGKAVRGRLVADKGKAASSKIGKQGQDGTDDTSSVKPAAKPVVKSAAKTKPGTADKGSAGSMAESGCETGSPGDRAQQFLIRVTELMGVNVSVTVRRDEEGNVRVDMLGDTLGILIGRRGETLDALQYLTSLCVNRGQEDYVRVTLDTENYRAKREEALTRLANRMASRAVKTGRKVVLEPMNPYERRILHSALQLNEAVTTHSEGEEPNRHVVITLK